MKDLIFGQASILEAVRNPKRTECQLYATREALKKNRIKGVAIKECSPHDLQEMAKKFCLERGVSFQRVPSGMFLLTQSLPEKKLPDLYPLLETGGRLLALDGVTDTHNVAAILRTATFFQVAAVLVSRKHGFALTPSFFRVSSGAAEHTPLVNTASLPSALRQLAARGASIVGVWEEGEREVPAHQGAMALVLGDEERGLSHAVKRVVSSFYALEGPRGKSSLNVSVAAALAMERCF